MKLNPKWVLHNLSKFGHEASINPLSATANAIGEGVVRSAEFIGKQSFKQVDKEFHNGYTGLKETKRAKLGIAAAAGLFGYSAYQYKNLTPNKVGPVDYAGPDPSESYDAVANTTNAPTLGASGAMVFGLNKGRRG